MNIALWICQGLLGAMYGMAGVMKTLRPVEKLGERMPWVKRYSVGMVRFIGIVEFLGAVGIIVPWATGILPILTPLSALGFATIQVIAAIDHLRNGEGKSVPINIVLFALAAFVAYGRWV